MKGSAKTTVHQPDMGQGLDSLRLGAPRRRHPVPFASANTAFFFDIRRRPRRWGLRDAPT